MTSSLSPFPALLRRVDRLAAGRRQRDLRAPGQRVGTPVVQRRLRLIAALLGVEIVIGAVAVVIAVMHLLAGSPDPIAVWVRTLVVLGLTVSVAYFTLRAAQGWYWSYSRMRLFAWIFPVVTLTIAAIPGLFPTWMIVEQILFAVVMLAIAALASSPAMRAAFDREALRRADPYEP